MTEPDPVPKFFLLDRVAERKLYQKELTRLTMELAAARACVAFYRSVIIGSEKWSPACEEHFERVMVPGAEMRGALDDERMDGGAESPSGWQQEVMVVGFEKIGEIVRKILVEFGR